MHKNAYIFRTTHLVRWSYYSICIKTYLMKRSHDGCSFVRVGKTKRVAELVYQGLRLGSCLKVVFININLSLSLFSMFFLPETCPCLCGCPESISLCRPCEHRRPTSTKKTFHQNLEIIGHLGKKAWARVPPGPSNGSPSPCSPLALCHL